MSFYERLTAQDASFIGLEDSRCHMHVGGVMLFDAAPLRTARGRHRHRPHPARHRGAPAPGAALPPAALLPALRATADLGRRRPLPPRLPRPPHGAAQARRRADAQAPGRPHHVAAARPHAGRSGRCGSSRGSSDDRLALISKTHHCMIDGVAGADLISVIMEPLPNREPGEPLPWMPRPHPSDARLRVRRGAASPRPAVRRAARRPAGDPPSRDDAGQGRGDRRRARRGVLAVAEPGLAAADQHRGRAVAPLRLDRDAGRRPEGGEERARRHAQRRRAGDGGRRPAPLLPAARRRSRHAQRPRPGAGERARAGGEGRARQPHHRDHRAAADPARRRR